MSALKKGSFTLSDDIYDVDIFVCVGMDYDRAQWLWHAKNKRKAKDIRIFADDSPSRLACVFVHNDHRNCCIWFRHAKPPGFVVAHEAFHAAYHVLRNSGLVLTTESEEAFGYYLGWLVRQIGKKVW